MNVGPTTDMDRLEQFLQTDPIWCCYMIGDLEEPFASSAQWISAATPDGDIKGALLVFTKYSPVTLVSFGDPEAAEAMLQCEGVPDKAFCHIPVDHKKAFRSRFELRKVETMRRMFLRTGNFAPVRADQPKRLGEEDLDSMKELYQHYPGHFFDPFQAKYGVYYGIRDNGAMVSVAGTHIYSTQRRFAVLGNIVTHRNYRGKGLATACASKLLQELFQTVDLVLLSVADGNAPAVRSYEKLGFATHTQYLEAQARRK